jgi:hypothetical protein
LPSKNNFRIDKCDDCIRITRIDIEGDLHCHLHSRQLAETIINNVCSEKIPLHSQSRTLECMARLSNDDDYIAKINELLETKKNKSKQTYRNSNKGKKGKN